MPVAGFVLARRHVPDVAELMVSSKVSGSMIQSTPPEFVASKPPVTPALTTLVGDAVSAGMLAFDGVAVGDDGGGGGGGESGGRKFVRNAVHATGGGGAALAPKAMVNEHTSRSTWARPPNGGPQTELPPTPAGMVTPGLQLKSPSK